MSACPVCEAPTQGRACEVCGHVFAPEVRAADLPFSPLPDLELPASVGGVPPVAPLLDLENTRFEDTAAPAVQPDPDWEQTRVGDVPDVVAGGLPELESGREAPDAERTLPTLASVTCRYCRNVQPSGLLCERCGMRLPWSAKVSSARVPLDPTLLVRCPQCGTRTYQRERCGSCGALLTPEG
jgi:hypothetical protein